MTLHNKKPIAVVKVGGDMLISASDRRGLADNVKALVGDGWQCLILHGGGPQVNALQKIYGLGSNKVDGRRITSDADLQVIKQALCGEVNVDLVSSLLAEGLPAFGCHGASGNLIQAKKRPPMDMANRGLIDFGEVGDVIGINVAVLESLMELGFLPVIASLGVDENGKVFNINADTTVSAIAQALQADLLILTTKVGGIFKNLTDANSRLPVVTPESARQLIADGTITEGMIPKVHEALALLDHGVGSIAITNASHTNNFLDIANGRAQTGTRLTAGVENN